MSIHHAHRETVSRAVQARTFHDAGADDWPELDISLLEESRSPAPAFPLDRLPSPWREWVADTARAAGAPVDYVALSVLAAVASLCGAGVAVRVTETWSEPLVLWQLVVGGRSSGKSPALAPVRRLLAALEAEWRATDHDGGLSQFVATNPSVEAIAEALAANPRGLLLWRDASLDWLGKGDDHARWLEAWAAGDRFAVSLFGATEPARLEEILHDNDGLAARLLYAWPGLPAFCPLAERKTPDDEGALKRLRRVARKAGTSDDPLLLPMDARGSEPFDAFLAGLHAELRHAEGPEAAWLGKGAGTVARLAGMLELLAWSGLDSAGGPGHLGRDTVEAAIGLWTDYFRPQARAVLDRAVPSDLDRRAQRVMRWLKDGGRTEVSRQEVRREALGRTVDAAGADLVLYRLTALGAVRSAPLISSGGRPARRWQVNPALAEA